MMNVGLQEQVNATKERLENLDSPSDFETLDVKYIADSNREIRNIILVTTTGGPRIEIDLGKSMVRGYWSGDSISEELHNVNVNRLWEHFKTIWESGGDAA